MTTFKINTQTPTLIPQNIFEKSFDSIYLSIVLAIIIPITSGGITVPNIIAIAPGNLLRLYPISTPKPIKEFVFNDIPDIDALTYGIICAFDFGRVYMHSCTETKFECDNYKFVITYDSDSCIVNVVCEKMDVELN